MTGKRRLKRHEHSFEAVPAVVVADKRDRFGKRLGIGAFALLLFFFVILGLVESAKNGDKIDKKQPVVVPTPSVVVTVKPIPTPVPVVMSPQPGSVVIVPVPGKDGSNGKNGAPGKPGSPAPSARSSAKPSPSPSPTCVIPVPPLCGLPGRGPLQRS